MDALSCPFCHVRKEDVVLRNDLCFALWDRHPASKGHVLIIPFRHLPSYFDTTHNEKLALIGMIEKCRMLTEKQFQPDGYNIGVNIGESAGQTIMHLHIHMIPRYLGDIADPRGGVRGAIPDKRIY